MQYQGLTFTDGLHIEELFSLHYFEYMSTFSFPGESHDFWEFICVDKGEVTIGAGEAVHTLKRGQIAFHKPNEFHWVKANGSVAPNLIVISFSCHSPMMDFFCDKILNVEESERRLLARTITEAGNYLEGRLDDPYQTALRAKEDAAPASGQLIRIFLEQLLISLYRRYNNISAVPQNKKADQLPDKTIRENNDTELFNQITAYLNQNLAEHITIEKICRDNLIGRSQLQKLFQKRIGAGIIEYFSDIKIDAAKQMIRTEQMNFTQISESLGYSSIHYFSRQFKKMAGMTPSEYASSIRAIAERAPVQHAADSKLLP